MKRLKGFIEKNVEAASIKKALLATCIFGILFYIIDYSPIGVSGLLRITGGANILDFETGYSVEKAYGMLEALGEAGRSFYLTKILPVDFPFPISFMLFYVSWMSLLLKHCTKNGSSFRWLIGLPLINMCCDWGENIGFILMLVNFPARLETVCFISNLITRLKFICVGLIILSFILLLSGSMIKKVCKLGNQRS